MPRLFISHATADQALVDTFHDYVVRLGSGVSDPDDVFYSSGSDTGVPSGEDLNAYVRRQAGDADLVITIITPAFMNSAYCLAELGAAWVSAGHLFPIVAPPLSHTDLDGVLRGVAVRALDDPAALDELHDRIKQATGAASNARTWGQYRSRWLEALPDLLEGDRPQPTPRRGLKPAPPRGDRTAAEDRGGGRYAWGHLFDSLVDAALYVRDEEVARTDIERHIHAGTVIPSRYHYSCDSCADNWIRRCKEPTYHHQKYTTEFWAGANGKRFVDVIREEIGSDTFDFVSLGPGDGQKDADIIFNWLQTGVDLLYYPYDISLPLAATAVQSVRDRASMRGNRQALRIKAVLADFRHLDKVRNVFLHRSAPNVVSLLGTLGNLESDLGFLRSLRDVMGREDLLMLEVRLRSDRRLPQLVTNSSLRHDFGPLEYYLGLEFDRSMMKVSDEEGVSAIPNTETIVVSYEGPVPGERNAVVTLQYIHLYEPDSFIQAVRQLGFDVVGEPVVEKEKAFLECLIRRAS